MVLVSYLMIHIIIWCMDWATYLLPDRQYASEGMMILFNLPCVVAVCSMHRIMEKVYLDHYLVSQKLESLVIHDQLTGVYNRNKLEELSTPDGEALIFQKELPVSIFIVHSFLFT